MYEVPTANMTSSTPWSWIVSRWVGSIPKAVRYLSTAASRSGTAIPT
jgi:hypothetical protein